MLSRAYELRLDLAHLDLCVKDFVAAWPCDPKAVAPVTWHCLTGGPAWGHQRGGPPGKNGRAAGPAAPDRKWYRAVLHGSAAPGRSAAGDLTDAILKKNVMGVLHPAVTPLVFSMFLLVLISGSLPTCCLSSPGNAVLSKACSCTVTIAIQACGIPE